MWKRPLARQGSDRSEDRSKKPVKSGKFEKHRTDYLFKKMEKEEKKKALHVTRLLLAFTGARGIAGSYSALRFWSQYRATVALSPVVSFCFCKYVCVCFPSLATGWPNLIVHRWAQLFIYSVVVQVSLRLVRAPQHYSCYQPVPPVSAPSTFQSLTKGNIKSYPIAYVAVTSKMES